jgi:bacillithiol synthase
MLDAPEARLLAHWAACIMTTASMESHCISFREIPETTELFISFLEDFRRVSAYYAHPPTIAGVEGAAKQVNLAEDIRKRVVEVLREQNARFADAASAKNSPSGGRDAASLAGPAPDLAIDPKATARNLDRLAAGAVAIVTGQQVGLFSGPAYSVYKAISAVRCADELTRRGIDAVPIFWLATADHDLAEVNHVFWNTRQGLARYELPAREKDAGRRVGEIQLGEEIQAIAATAAQTLDGPFAADLTRELHESYAPGETYGSALGKLMTRLLAGRGIIFIDPLDARLQKLAAPLYLRAVQQSEPLRQALLDRSKELEAAGFHAQVKVTRESTLLFYDIDGKREPVRARADKGDTSVAGQREFSRQQLTAAIEKNPEAFTPNALFRPVVQDALLPTAAYIGGPSEIAYLAQSQVIYREMLGRMPAILPRASFTLVEPPIARFMGKYGLTMRDIFAGPQSLRAHMERKSLPEDLARAYDRGEESLRTLLASFEPPLKELDPTLLGALQATEQKILYLFGQLREKIGRAENFRSGVLDRHQRILLDALYPEGGLQERSLCSLPFIAEHGPELLDQLARLTSIAGLENGPSCVHQHHVLCL